MPEHLLFTKEERARHAANAKWRQELDAKQKAREAEQKKQTGDDGGSLGMPWDSPSFPDNFGGGGASSSGDAGGDAGSASDSGGGGDGGGD
ncbi:MAG: hypothetical protein V4773_21385 [Verrucomicrobiota bacterium]